ncbi:MAG: ABC transporter permease subunit [Oscillospiraceae bacterium]|nr:ABC transporter permease subunit [Oscillospiraceae bacterium]
MSAIFKRDLRAYFKSPLGYVYLAAFLLVLNIYFYVNNVYIGSSSLDGIFSFIVTMCVFLIPILTMRTFSEDYKQKTDQLLFTAPVRLTGIVMGKFLAALVVFLLGILITVVYMVIVSSWGTLELATVIGNYIAICATAMAFISIGVFISSLTQNQLVACIATVGTFLALYLMDYSYSLMNATWAKNLIYYFSMFRRYQDFAQGIFSFADLIFYLSVAGTFVFLTVRLLERKRWS